MAATHTFTTTAPTWPLHVIDPRGFAPWEYEPDEFDRDADEDCGEFDDFDCGVGPDGLCMNAGSEWCDFEWPMRDLLASGRGQRFVEEASRWFEKGDRRHG